MNIMTFWSKRNYFGDRNPERIGGWMEKIILAISIRVAVRRK